MHNHQAILVMYHFKLIKMVGVEGKIMTQVVKRNLMALFIAVVCSALFIFLGARVNAQEVQADGTVVESTEQQVETNSGDEAVEAEPVEETTVEAEEESDDTTEDASYTFTAQPGDSYTKIARKSIQIFGFENAVDLSGAQIVYLETNLTQLAGSPELEVGETVTISKATISEWAEKAKTLTEVQTAAWQVYADKVDFNTNNVGEARS